MADKKGIVVIAKGVKLADKNETLDKLNKKAAVMPNADSAGLADKAAALGAKKVTAANIAEVLEKEPLVIIEGGVEAIAQALDAANRRTLVTVAGDDGVAFYGLGINSKAGKVERKADADDIALTIATVTDVPIGPDCEARVLYQVFKDPNLKLNEIVKLQEALARMESVVERNNREPWDKHDCA